MPVQPQNIGPSAGFIRVWIPDIMPENLPIGERPAPAFSITGQIHGTGRVIIMKTVARAAIRSRLGVVATVDEFRCTVNIISITASGSGMMI